MNRITFNVKGMHCTACEKLITYALENEGVKMDNISFKKEIVSMTYDNNKISLQKIKEIITNEGYELK